MPLPAKLRAKLDVQASETIPVLTIDEFFDGNDDVASIGCNLSEPPPLATFRQTFAAVATRSDVQDVLVRVTDDMGDDEWPFTDQIFVLTSASPEQVGEWFAGLECAPPQVEDEWPGPTAFLPSLLPGMRSIVVWWD